MTFYPLEQLANLHDGYKESFEINGIRLLLIQQQDAVFLVENKCGHFGVPLEDGRLQNDSITCKGHGIEFSLKTGEIINRPWENCDPIRIFAVVYQGDAVGVELGSEGDAPNSSS